MVQAGSSESAFESAGASRIWIAKLTLTDFRNYRNLALTCGPGPCVLAGPNGAGKTNCLEAISLLSAGRGLRALPFPELSRAGGEGGWAIAAKLFVNGEEMRVGTGVQLGNGAISSARTPRIVKIDEIVTKGSGALAHIRMLWLTPAMDSLFTGPAIERRRFLDRLTLSLDPHYAKAASIFDRAMRQRNKALEVMSPPQLLDSVEVQMAQAAVAVARARHWAARSLSSEITAERDRDPESAFPWAIVALKGHLESQIEHESCEAVEESYRRLLAFSRERDRATGRTLTGPHRSDLEVSHGPKGMPAKMCSTGEQKALLIGLILAQARLVKASSRGVSPLVLLDEIAAHLDSSRRLALFSAVSKLGAQVWMTGTDLEVFAPLKDMAPALFFLVSNGAFAHASDAESGSKP